MRLYHPAEAHEGHGHDAGGDEGDGHAAEGFGDVGYLELLADAGEEHDEMRFLTMDITFQQQSHLSRTIFTKYT